MVAACARGKPTGNERRTGRRTASHSESFDTRAGNAHSLTSNEAHYLCAARLRIGMEMGWRWDGDGLEMWLDIGVDGLKI